MLISAVLSSILNIEDKLLLSLNIALGGTRFEVAEPTVLTDVSLY
jgi:hypothetical protein